MDEINRHDHKEYAYLRQLPIDKLLELLAVAPALSDKPEDEAYMSALAEVIIEKENENPTGFFPDVDQQWNDFVIDTGAIRTLPQRRTKGPAPRFVYCPPFLRWPMCWQIEYFGCLGVTLTEWHTHFLTLQIHDFGPYPRTAGRCDSGGCHL